MYRHIDLMVVFFFQAEDGIRDGHVTGVQTCALPIFPAAIAVAVALTMAIGGLVEVTFLRWLGKASVLRMILITIGVAILLREAALVAWGSAVRALPYFTGDEVTALDVAGARVSPQVVWTLATCAAIVVLLGLFFRHTALGRQMRACASNGEAARLCGLPVRNLVTLSFVLCGGLGSSFAAVGAGLLVGVLEAFSVSLLPAAYKETVSVTVLLAILFLRPSGLFGAGGTSRAGGQG